VLPLVTVAHGVSGANNFYWPELYVDLPISDYKACPHYAWDTPNRATWEGTSSFDPVLFYSVGEYADDAVSGRLSAKYTPLEVASWLDELVGAGEAALNGVEPPDSGLSAQAQRTVVDLQILARLGRFFAGKFRAAVEYALYRRNRDSLHLEACIEQLRGAHSAYAEIADVASGVYQDDLAFGVGLSDRGSWQDRLAAMHEDRQLLEIELERLGQPTPTPSAPSQLAHRATRRAVEAEFRPPVPFERGAPVKVCLTVTDLTVDGAVLRYRHLNQAEDYEAVTMVREGDDFTATIPAGFTTEPYPLMYFAELRRSGDHPVMVPTLGKALAEQPYVVVHSVQAATGGR
jgi:hypothetical protein